MYYGFKLGCPVPWCYGFPFNVFTMHPQYTGCVLTILGAVVLGSTPAHVQKGWLAVGWVASGYYVYMAAVEDIPTEHPLDTKNKSPSQDARQDVVQLRRLHELKWSMPRSGDFYTSDNVMGFIVRPWFPMFLASLIALNTFTMVLSLPIAILYLICAVKDNGCVLWASAVCAAGAALGSAALGWDVERTRLAVHGLRWAAGDIRLRDVEGGGSWWAPLSWDEVKADWPRTVARVAEHGWSGCVVASCWNHPVPIVLAGLKQNPKIPGTALAIAVFLGTFVQYLAMGVFISMLSCALKHSKAGRIASDSGQWLRRRTSIRARSTGSSDFDLSDL